MNFLKKIFSPTILIISAVLLFYTFYQSEIYWSGKQRSYYLIYYLILSVLTIFSIISFFISSKLKEYFIILVISIVFSLYLFEGYLILKENLANSIILKEKLNKKEKNKILKAKLYKKKQKKNGIQDRRCKSIKI